MGMKAFRRLRWWVAARRHQADLREELETHRRLVRSLSVVFRRARDAEQRTREIGIRMALGAGASQSSGWSVTLGLLAGFAGAAVAGTVLRSSLYGLSAIDPLAYVSAALLLAIAGPGATFVPARRATRVDPSWR